MLQPGFLAEPSRQKELLAFLLARGADPWKPVPGGVHGSVIQYARFLQSPHVSLLDAPPQATTVPSTGLMAQAIDGGSVNDVAAHQKH